MSLEKVDIKFKVDPTTLCFLKAAAKGRNIHVADLVREILDGYAAAQRVTYMETRRLLENEGLLGDVEGGGGRFAAREAGAVDLDSIE